MNRKEYLIDKKNKIKLALLRLLKILKREPNLFGKVVLGLIKNGPYKFFQSFYDSSLEPFDETAKCKKVKPLEYQGKISIITPVWDTPEYVLKKAIQSVLRQTYKNWELCIADGNSNEEVKRILNYYSKIDERIKVKFLSENRGISGNSNEALTLATGEYICLLDSDDKLYKNALEQAIIYINEYSKPDIVYSDEDKIDKNGFFWKFSTRPSWNPEIILQNNYLTHALAIKKDLFDKVGNFRSEFDGAQDYDLFLRMSEITDNIVHIPKILYSWRAIKGSAALSLDEKKYAIGAGKMALKFASERRKIKH